MKKVFTLFFVSILCAGFYANAQVLATFEDDADELVNWGKFPDWHEAPRFIEGGAPQIGANPEKAGLNKSDKCLIAINIADADWWGNFVSLWFNEPITVTESNRYLRYMAYRSIQPKNFRVAFNGHEDANQIFQGKTAKDGQWVGMVADVLTSPWAKALTTAGKDLKIEYMKIILSNNWDNPRTGWGVATYMFDDFELSDNPMPPGVTLKDGAGLSVGFEQQSELDEWIGSIDMQHASNKYEIIDNPFTDSKINGKGKIFKFNKSADANWWQGGPRFDFNGVMPIGGGKNPEFLHVAVYVPSAVFADREGSYSIDIQLCVKNHMGNEISEIFMVWDDETDEWIDLVMDVSKLNFLSEVTVRFDVLKNASGSWINSPANTYYLDAIAFNSDSEPRKEIIAGLPKILPAGDFAKIYALPGGLQISTTQNATVQVYNLLGGLVKSVPASFGTTNIAVDNGIYIVKVNSASGEKQVAKVLVK